LFNLESYENPRKAAKSLAEYASFAFGTVVFTANGEIDAISTNVCLISASSLCY
jgi:hypothetical protein